ncbi:MAG: tetratricopeptide repeat protein [Saprospiraceae bacterium]|nr:tetratricopeptide repeat protein [Saprospiraceae bacterium]
MTMPQALAVVGAILLTLLLYFGFDTRSPKQQKEIERRELAGSQIDIKPFVITAKGSLADVDLREIEQLEAELARSDSDSVRSQTLKKISGAWYKHQNYLVAGHFAEQVAEIDSTELAWSIAGTTYFPGISNADQVISNACFEKAVECLEYAISLNPDEISHRVNLAMVYVRKPTQDNPMQGIQMLIGLNQNFPDNVLVLSTLGQLALETGQWERAKERLERALQLDQNNSKVICMLADAYRQIGDVRASDMQTKCELLTVK